MSRVVSGSVERALELRQRGLWRDRSSLSLTPAGKRFYSGLMQAAKQRKGRDRAAQWRAVEEMAVRGRGDLGRLRLPVEGAVSRASAMPVRHVP